MECEELKRVQDYGSTGSLLFGESFGCRSDNPITALKWLISTFGVLLSSNQDDGASPSETTSKTAISIAVQQHHIWDSDVLEFLLKEGATLSNLVRNVSSVIYGQITTAEFVIYAGCKLYIRGSVQVR